MKTLGICFGASTMQCVLLESDPDFIHVAQAVRIAHEGNPQKAFREFIGSLDLFEIERVAVTGKGFKSKVRLTSLSEPEAVEVALQKTYAQGQYPDLVVSAGGETQLIYKISSHGTIVSVHSGSKCASGTGEFFLQQIRRMGLQLEEAVALAEGGTPRKIAGRCSVFCKSDCTHALNKGELRANITAGLCVMMADKITELIKDMECQKLSIIGGGSMNRAMVQVLRSRFPGVDVPEYATAFEAFGAALWALDHPCIPFSDNTEKMIGESARSFAFHAPLAPAKSLVDFKPSDRGKIQPDDTCILGLDVGSTTTKAVLLRPSDRKILASVYLKTNGRPVEASQECYRSILGQIGDTPHQIIALGVTGSGRQIAALHALTENVINEIIAHAAGAAFFDKEVDTIFEIGGQDAKYIYLTGGVPSDYAMNEACSAGTGSFLEESAIESLNVKVQDIGRLALLGERPPNFSDQCAAFISSDIKKAGQEGIEKTDILAGLVYSICLNYLNRVRGARPTGKKIFMQGGVCYNPAVPVAMASLMKTPIIVPPDPGLVGAFGVALEVAHRLENGLAAPGHFDLRELITRTAEKKGSFVCAGGRSKCDRKCEINQIRVNEKVYPFGGACNKYYNLRLHKEVDAEAMDLVKVRQKLLFETYSAVGTNKGGKTVGICRSFLAHSLLPLYSHFFSGLGFEVVLSDEIDPEGISRAEAAFCLPAEISHGTFVNLLKKKVDYIFLPQVMQVPVPHVSNYTRLCVFVQGEPYYLRTTFRKELEGTPTVLLSPVLKMHEGYDHAEKTMVRLAQDMGIPAQNAKEAYQMACKKQKAFEAELVEHGKKALASLDENPDLFGIVVFGRPYNAFSSDANMGIPHKIASRGFVTIPLDMLPCNDIPVHRKLYWAMGQKIMKAAKLVKQRKNLFGVYITNFSCGPDSFLIGYFRNLMKTKPSLTLEIDQHTADAGIDTRVEAALDIIANYLKAKGKIQDQPADFLPAHMENTPEGLTVVASGGERLSLYDQKNVELVFPSMGRYGTESLAAIFCSMGIRAKALPVATDDVLLIGRKHTTCKECLPYIVTTGSLLHYLKNKPKAAPRVTVFFMATGSGPCRLGQYATALEELIRCREIPDTAVLALSDENGYAGMGHMNLLKAWQAMVLSDVFGDIKSMLSVTAKNKKEAFALLESIWKECIAYFERKFTIRFSIFLDLISQRLAEIPLKTDPADVPVISLVGEIYVRRDEFSRKNIVDYLESHGFMVKVAPTIEYLWYSNYVAAYLGEKRFPFQERVKMRLTVRTQEWWERKIKSIMAQSGLCRFEMVEVEKTIKHATHLLNENFRGECILTVGLSLREILRDSCGVISIGPFGCMPSRMAEAILKKEMTVQGKQRIAGWEDKTRAFADMDRFPFLAVETDGSTFPQLVETNLEAFVLQARRLHQKLHAMKSTATFSEREKRFWMRKES